VADPPIKLITAPACVKMHGIAGDLTGACSLPSAHRRPKRRGGGYYADPLKKALDLAATRQIQQPKTITKLSVFACSTPLQIRLPALQRCRLNTSYTPFEAMRAMKYSLLPAIEANRKANLKNEADISPLVRGPWAPGPQSCGTCPIQDRSCEATIYPCR
jgi:hypothetical protein